MSVIRERSLAGLAIGVSMLALVAPQAAYAQDQAAEGDNATAAPAPESSSQDIVVTGIRASLRSAQNVKRNAQGIVDAISAEDIGKFPDSNLAESLQRVTGVSIDRANGEGQYVTVRGFGPEFNLVTLNGRQMPTSTLGDGVSAPSSRAFDFGNLASEGIAGLEVYKSGRATVPSGGIGSLINIKTTRPLDAPGRKGSFSVKGVYDSSRREGSKAAPELSGVFSDTFADGKVGIAISGSYQRRKSTENAADVLYQSWATVQAPGGSWAYGNANPAPDDGAVVQTPITMGYSFMDLDRQRINGQATLQVRPVDNLTFTVDFTHSRNKVRADKHRVGLWFARAALSSGWDKGNPAPPLYFQDDYASPTDIALEGAKTANKNLNNSLGLNAKWEPTDRLTLEFDGHRSTARSLPASKYGSSQSVQAAIFGATQKRIDFTTYLPQINYNEATGVDTLDPAGYFATGNSYRNGYFRDEIWQAQGRGRYDFDTSFLDSLDFGVSYTDNGVRSAFGVFEQASWGGAQPLVPAAGNPPLSYYVPDDIFSSIKTSDLFGGLKGANGDILPAFLYFDTDALTKTFIETFGACNGGPTCLADYTRVDSRIKERTLAPYVQLNNKFDLFGNPAHLTLGLRYEKTRINSTGLSQTPDNTAWVSANEFSFLYGNNASAASLKGSYKEWLPNVDFDMSPIKDVKLRASYSHTIARPNYSQMGALTYNELRATGGLASAGNPGLLPYKSKNIDLSAEWYYGPASYVSLGYFRKRVSNFIFDQVTSTNLAGLRTPIGGPRYLAAVAALGAGATSEQIRDYIFANYPGSTNATGTDSQGHTTGDIFALPEDPLINFQLSTQVNGDIIQKLHGIEAAIQHSFWDTGFGVILNYTRVRGGGKFDNSLPVGSPQFAISGLSDSANAVLFYDKNGFQARVAYNWRDKFLSGYGQDPSYVEAYGQVDASASYEFRKGLTVFAEGINLTGSNRRGYSRTTNNVTFVIPGYARYALGLRYSF
ncbi:TonB-dependent receptor [Sphingomonas jaspsi]|uniref:TonB-dependent receptor n=1 Tax=Sphingomonas jaspsi TaxID=392409 RepID=UPI0004AF5A51|nr:TonB-dependent receptor [Sphingomonas jaspsi]